jgi:hypothetical protein
MPEDSKIQLALDGTGKNVKNFLLRGVVQSDGTSADVYVQCTAVVGSDGRLVNFETMEDILQDIRTEIKLIRRGFGSLTDDAELVLGPDGDEDISEEPND